VHGRPDSVNDVRANNERASTHHTSRQKFIRNSFPSLFTLFLAYTSHATFHTADQTSLTHTTNTMSGTSNVGTSAVYEAGDQRNPPDSEKAENQSTPYEEGKSNSHDQNDPSKLCDSRYLSMR
jgi:hypothetical protein